MIQDELYETIMRQKLGDGAGLPFKWRCFLSLPFLWQNASDTLSSSEAWMKAQGAETAVDYFLMNCVEISVFYIVMVTLLMIPGTSLHIFPAAAQEPKLMPLMILLDTSLFLLPIILCAGLIVQLSS